MSGIIAMGTYFYNLGDYTLEKTTRGRFALWCGDQFMGYWEASNEARDYAMEILDHVPYKSKDLIYPDAA